MLRHIEKIGAVKVMQLMTDKNDPDGDFDDFAHVDEPLTAAVKYCNSGGYYYLEIRKELL